MNFVKLFAIAMVVFWATPSQAESLHGSHGAGGGIISFLPDPADSTQGLQDVIDIACTAGTPQIIEFGSGTMTIDATGFTDAALRDGIIDIPEECDSLTFQGQGPNNTFLNFEYDLDDADVGGGAAAVDLRVFRIRGSRWIQFRDMTIAARNDCNENYTYGGTEECIADGRIMFSIDQSTSNTHSRNIVFDNVHLHFPTTHPTGNTPEHPNVVRALNSEEVHITNSVIHGNGILVAIDDCKGCTINYNWFGSAFPKSDGPHGTWHGDTPYAESNADQTDAEYTREWQTAIMLGFGEGKTVIGNRFDMTMLPYSIHVNKQSNGTAAIVMGSTFDLTGAVPRGALVLGNTIYNVMDHIVSMVYFINYNGAIVSGNSFSCAVQSNPINCLGGALVRFASAAEADPDGAYNRENIITDNMALGFGTNWAEAGTLDEPQQGSSCFTFYGPTAAHVSAKPTQAALTNRDNVIAGNICGVGLNGKFVHNAVLSGSLDVTRDQFWGRGNFNITSGLEFSTGGFSHAEDRTVAIGNPIRTDACGQTLSTAGASGAIQFDLPVVSRTMGVEGCSMKIVNMTVQDLFVCAVGQNFVFENDPEGTTGKRCIFTTNFQQSVDIISLFDRSTSIDSISYGASTEITFSNATSSEWEDDDRVFLLMTDGGDELHEREFILDNVTCCFGSQTADLLQLDGTTAFNSTGFTTFVSGSLNRMGWMMVANEAGLTNGAGDWATSGEKP